MKSQTLIIGCGNHSKRYWTLVHAIQKPHYYVGLKINVSDSENTKPIGLSFRPINSISSELLVDLMENVIQSNDVFDIYEQLEISMQIIEVPSGSGQNLPLNYLSEENVLKHKKATFCQRTQSTMTQNVYRDH